MAVINLVKIGQQLALTGRPIHAAIDNSGEAVEVSADKLANKIPELKALKDTVIFRIYKNKSNGAYECKTLTIYLDDEGKPSAFTPNLKPLSKVQFTAFKTGLNGFQRIKYEGVELEIETSISDEYRESLITWGVIEGEGTPEPQFLAEVPHPTTPLKDLPKDVTFKVIKGTGTDKKFGSARYLIQNTENKKEFEVYENSDLREMIAEYGFETEFKIGNVVKKASKKGEPDSYFVKLIDLKKPTFEDIAI